MRRLALAGLIALAPFAAARANYVYLRMILGGDRQTDQNSGNSQGGGQGQGGQQGERRTVQYSVQAVVECTLQPVVTPGRYRITHKWGSTSLFNDDKTLISNLLPGERLKARASARHTNLNKNGRKPERLLEHAEWLLQHGLIEDCDQFFTELVNNKEDKDGSSKLMTDALAAYRAYKAASEKAVERDDLAKKWHQKLSVRRSDSKVPGGKDGKETRDGHYTLLYNAQGGNPPEVESRLDMLEQNFKAFYLWWASKGVTLPLPEEKLVCVLLDSPEDFLRQRAEVEEEALTSDGFFATRDNIVVFSTQRLDPQAYAFGKVTQAYWQGGWDRAALLKGGAALRGKQVPVDEQRRMMTIALIDKALEEEGERAAVTHEGCRQLLVASGLHAKNVLLPQWLQFGMGAFFETPKGPFIGAQGPTQVAFYPGYGGPSWAYSRILRKSLPPQGMEQAPQLMGDIVSDDMFNAVFSPADRENLYKARAFSWSLCYFLARNRPTGVVRFYQELAKESRDLELDPKRVRGCFARAFNVGNAAQTDIDGAAFTNLAKEWYGFIQVVNPPGAEFGLDAPPPANPNPGGTPPPGGGQPNPPGGGNRPGGRPGGR